MMDDFFSPHDVSGERTSCKEVVVTLPEKILGYPWTSGEIYQLAVWADQTGSGSASDLLRAVAEAVEASEEE